MEFEVVIEIPKDQRNKYEMDHGTGGSGWTGCCSLLPGTRHDYAFVEHTLADDGDPLDALVILDEPTFPGSLISCRAIGMSRKRAIEIGADAAGIGLTIHPHPTPSETLGMAAEAFEGTISACTCRREDSRRRGLLPAEDGGGCRWPWVLRPAGRHTCRQLQA